MTFIHAQLDTYLRHLRAIVCRFAPAAQVWPALIATVLLSNVLVVSVLTSCGSAADTAAWLTFEQTVVRAAVSVEVSAQEAGSIRTSAVKLNQPVAAAEMLFQLDDQEVQLAMEQAEDELLRAQVAIDKAKAVLMGAKSSADHRREDLERHRKLGDSISDAERRNLQEAVEKAEVEHVVAYSDYLQTKHQAEIGQVRVRAAELRRDRMQINAPFSGEITRVLVQPGERVEIGEPLVELRAMERMLADFEVPEEATDLRSLIGKPIEVVTVVAGAPRKLSGSVVSADSEVNARGMVRVHVEILNEWYDDRWVLLHGKSVTLRVQHAGLVQD